MKKVYIISTCIKKSSQHSIFHFKGYYRGKRITQIRVLETYFEVNKEYLIKLVNPYVTEEILIGTVEKKKLLFE